MLAIENKTIRSDRSQHEACDEISLLGVLKTHVPRLKNNIKLLGQIHQHPLVDRAIWHLHTDRTKIGATRLPIFPPVRFQHPAIGRGRSLLVLTRISVASERRLETLQVLRCDLVWPQQLPHLVARIGPANGSRASTI